ncbi:acyl-CoA dehydrogenase [cyanobiont of Ornithocercus magnificus]|nr:acyl-CoA dehydrogenase [cyanobiont of Ornithocercus magnificus]
MLSGREMMRKLKTCSGDQHDIATGIEWLISSADGSSTVAVEPMKMVDPMGPAEVSIHIDAAAEALLMNLTTNAANHEKHGLPRAVMDRLAAIGWLGTAPAVPLQRERAERLAMADVSVWFCWSQHQSPLRLLQSSSNNILRDRWLESLANGKAVGATAFAHLRRHGPANPIACPVPHGWELNGRLDWITGWDLADVVAVQMRAGHEKDAPVLALMLERKTQEQLPKPLQLFPPLELMVMGGTWSRPLKFNRHQIDDDAVLSSMPFETWCSRDKARTRFANPAAFGLARAALGDLRQQCERYAASSWLNGFQRLLAEARELRYRCYAAVDRPDELSNAQHHRLRAAALDLAQRCCQAALISHSGSAMYTGHASGRRLREAAFLQVQALIPPVQERLINSD